MNDVEIVMDSEFRARIIFLTCEFHLSNQLEDKDNAHTKSKIRNSHPKINENENLILFMYLEHESFNIVILVLVEQKPFIAFME